MKLTAQNDFKISVIIPAINEQKSLGYVLNKFPIDSDYEIIVVDGGSIDQTVDVATTGNATVIIETEKGYGLACAKGAEHAQGDILVFMDADGANNPTEISNLVQPILKSGADLVLGSRIRGSIAKGAMPWHQRTGNILSAKLISMLYGISITDLAPFRAIRKESLKQLQLFDLTYGWPTEMIVKAAKSGFSIHEVPVDYFPRYAGKSKISGTVRGSIFAAIHIFNTIFRSYFE